MQYFAYGSNMCSERLKKRVLSAQFVCSAIAQSFVPFPQEEQGQIGKGRRFLHRQTGRLCLGVIFEFNQNEKAALDEAEGLNQGYVEKNVTIVDADNWKHHVFTYVADSACIDWDLSPYSWYTRFVIEGARQHGLPADYIAKIEAVPDTEDPDKKRDAENRAIQCGGALTASM